MKQPLAMRLIPMIFAVIGVIFLGVAAVSWFAVPEDRETAMVLTMVFGFIGTIFTFLGVVLLVTMRNPEKKRRRLMETGERVMARVVDIEKNRSLQVNGRYPWRLICQYEEGGVVYQCRSGNLWSYPNLTGEMVPVYRERGNYKNYYVDVEAVLRPTVEL